MHDDFFPTHYVESHAKPLVGAKKMSQIHYSLFIDSVLDAVATLCLRNLARCFDVAKGL